MSKFKARSHETNQEHIKQIESSDFNPDYVLLGTSMFERYTWAEDAKESFNEHLSEFKIANFGCGGDKLCNILYRCSEGRLLETLSKKCSPKILVFMAGANDMEFGNPKTASSEKDEKELQKLYNIYITIVDLIKKYLPDTKLILMGMFPRTSEKYSDETMLRRQKRFNELVKTIVDNYIYVGDQLLHSDTVSNEIINKDMFFDNVHLNKKGYDIMSSKLKDVFNST